MLPTIIIASVIGVIFTLVIVNEIFKKKRGKSSCSCGGNCGACGLCHIVSQEMADRSEAAKKTDIS